MVDCPGCNGTGELILPMVCPDCGGEKKVTSEDAESIKDWLKYMQE